MSPYCPSYNSYDDSLEDLVAGQLITITDIFFFFVTCIDIVRRKSVLSLRSYLANKDLPVGGSTMTFASALKECNIILAVV